MTGLYLITNDDEFSVLHQKLKMVAKIAPISMLQYRRKHIALDPQQGEIEELMKICQRENIQFIINDNLSYAQQFGCGLHLGQGDGSVVKARAILGQQAIIGRTCHNSLELAATAQQDGASYLAFGAVYPSLTKPNVSRVTLDTLRQAKQQCNLPICAIGGLTVDNSQPLVDMEIDLLAIVGNILNLSPNDIPMRMAVWRKLLGIS
ncbi:MAG: thiamine phosphate synthase [Moraxellaceae bacterium]|nr:MAG: thiamine phosphate synthase [Moraxellaceae bacterium]